MEYIAHSDGERVQTLKEHLEGTARLAEAFASRFGKGDWGYCCGLLHDIGKYAQYEEGIPHEIKSAEIAGIILSDMPERIRFTPAEQQEILTAIRGHRKLRENAILLENLLYESDKASRTCFACPAEPECNWSTTKKNMEITI